MKEIKQSCECKTTNFMISDKEIYISTEYYREGTIYRKDSYGHSRCDYCQICGQPLTIVEAEEENRKTKDEFVDNLTEDYEALNCEFPGAVAGIFNSTNAAINKLNARVARLEKG